MEKNAGLCYSSCSPGYTGVGPVCWGAAPNGWVECGMGAAKDKKTCAETIINQVASVGNMVVNLVTLGSSSAAEGAESAGKLAQLIPKFNEIKAFYNSNKAVIDTAKAGMKIKTGVESMENAINAGKSPDVTVEDITRIAAEIASVIDPTGIAGVVAAYTYPKCSKYFPGGHLEFLEQ